MSWLRRFFKPRPDRFIQLLLQQADYTVQGAEALLEYMNKPNEKRAQAVRILEKEADEVRRILIDELNRTFVTPIDREDIFALSRAIDDVLDYAYTMPRTKYTSASSDSPITLVSQRITPCGLKRSKTA
jgi:uncharacterized protein Yka (UPF0111/DUF47 family)